MTRSLPLAAFASAFAGAVALAPALDAQSAPRVGTVVIAHGGDSLWNSHVIEAARAARTDGPLEISFLMGPAAKQARFQDAVAKLERAGVDSIRVVPVLVSSHSGHYDQLRWLVGEPVTLDESMHHHLHMAGIDRPQTKVPMRLLKAMDNATEIAEVLADRARVLAKQVGAEPAKRALLIVGHGPNTAEENAAWMENLRPIAERVKQMTGFRDVRVDLVRDDAPEPVRAEAVRHVRELIELQHAMTGADVLVVPVLVSKGMVSRDKVPADLRGTPHIYAGEPLLPHPAMVRWIEARAAGR